MQSLFLLDREGTPFIEKHWRGSLSRAVCETFWSEVQKAGQCPPVIATPKHYLIHIKRDNVYYLAVLNDEVPPLLIIDFLHRMVDIFLEYFETANDETLRESFITIYQLIDEMVDNGYPNITEPVILKEIVLPPSLLNQALQSVGASSGVKENLPGSSLSAIPWRKSNVRHGSNEIYFDVVEEIDAILDANGSSIATEVSGYISVNCRLSGTPDVTCKFSDPRMIDDIAVHPCVRYHQYLSSKVLSFVPPDGKFRLCSFRVAPNSRVSIPMSTKVSLTYRDNTAKLEVTLRALHSASDMEFVACTIPLPKNATAVSFTGANGAIDYDEGSRTLKWDVDHMPKTSSVTLTGSYNVPSKEETQERPVINLQFRVMQFSAASIKVESVTVSNERYKAFKGVRSVTKTGKFLIRS